MKTATILGIALIMLGVMAFTYQDATYTTREKVIDLGPLQATVVTTQTLPLPSLVGGGGPRRRHGVADRWSQATISSSPMCSNQRLRLPAQGVVAECAS